MINIVSSTYSGTANIANTYDFTIYVELPVGINRRIKTTLPHGMVFVRFPMLEPTSQLHSEITGVNRELITSSVADVNQGTSVAPQNFRASAEYGIANNATTIELTFHIAVNLDVYLKPVDVLDAFKVEVYVGETKSEEKLQSLNFTTNVRIATYVTGTNVRQTVNQFKSLINYNGAWSIYKSSPSIIYQVPIRVKGFVLKFPFHPDLTAEIVGNLPLGVTANITPGLATFTCNVWGNAQSLMRDSITRLHFSAEGVSAGSKTTSQNVEITFDTVLSGEHSITLPTTPVINVMGTFINRPNINMIRYSTNSIFRSDLGPDYLQSITFDIENAQGAPVTNSYLEFLSNINETLLSEIVLPINLIKTEDTEIELCSINGGCVQLTVPRNGTYRVGSGVLANYDYREYGITKCKINLIDLKNGFITNDKNGGSLGQVINYRLRDGVDTGSIRVIGGNYDNPSNSFEKTSWITRDVASTYVASINIDTISVNRNGGDSFMYTATIGRNNYKYNNYNLANDVSFIIVLFDGMVIDTQGITINRTGEDSGPVPHTISPIQTTSTGVRYIRVDTIGPVGYRASISTVHTYLRISIPVQLSRTNFIDNPINDFIFVVRDDKKSYVTQSGRLSRNNVNLFLPQFSTSTIIGISGSTTHSFRSIPLTGIIVDTYGLDSNGNRSLQYEVGNESTYTVLRNNKIVKYSIDVLNNSNSDVSNFILKIPIPKKGEYPIEFTSDPFVFDMNIINLNVNLIVRDGDGNDITGSNINNFVITYHIDYDENSSTAIEPNEVKMVKIIGTNVPNISNSVNLEIELGSGLTDKEILNNPILLRKSHNHFKPYMEITSGSSGVLDATEVGFRVDLTANPQMYCWVLKVDRNPESHTFGTFRYERHPGIDGVEPVGEECSDESCTKEIQSIWQDTGIGGCSTSNTQYLPSTDGRYRFKQQKDVNEKSVLFNELRWVRDSANDGICT